MRTWNRADAGVLAVLLLAVGTTAAQESAQLIVDQFGYRPDAEKMAVFADPVKGQNSANRYTPGETFEVRSADGKTVFTGKLQPWKNGQVDAISGDRVWRADFTEVKTPGRYVLFDPKNNVQSAAFDIRTDVYSAVLKVSMRTLSWFHDGSPLYDGPKSTYGPAPGFLAGGPNRSFGVKWVAPPFGEPPAKAFKQWNTGWNQQHNANEDPWAINEPAIYYQAAYNLVLSGLCAGTK